MQTFNINISVEGIAALKLEIELAESNYRYAIELQTDPHILLTMKEHIKQLKEQLLSLENSNDMV